MINDRRRAMIFELRACQKYGLDPTYARLLQPGGGFDGLVACRYLGFGIACHSR